MKGKVQKQHSSVHLRFCEYSAAECKLRQREDALIRIAVFVFASSPSFSIFFFIAIVLLSILFN